VARSSSIRLDPRSRNIPLNNQGHLGGIRVPRADRKYTTLATSYGAFLINSSLREMKEKLDPKMFWQIHRSVIVNVGAIDVIYRTFRGALEVKLKDRSELLPVSAAHAQLFTQTAP
jgi:DNA-binding LytR/AlgR family response regulator